MPETLALVRIAIASSRFLLLVMLAAFLIGQCLALFAIPIRMEFGRDLAILAVVYTLVGAGLASVVLFDYGDQSDMSLPDSGCSHWILRMPIHAWKIAAVPVILKTIWISVLWMLFSTTARSLGAGEQLQIFAPCIALSATVVWILVIAWRPFRSGWRRLAALAIAAPVLYCGIAAVFVAPFINQVEWRPLATGASIVLAIVLYLAGVIVVIRSVRLARVCSTGVIPEQGNMSRRLSARSDDYAARDYNSAHHALVHYGWNKSKGVVQKTMILAVIPTIVIFSLFVPLHIVSLILVVVMFAEFSAVSIATAAGEEDPHVMPPHLAASPLRTATIAWTRSLTRFVIAAGIFSCILFVFAGWACWPANREVWNAWAADRAASLGAIDATMIGVRWSTVIIFGSATVLLSRLASFLWIGMPGRAWFPVVMSLLIGLAYLIPIGVGLRWFMVQTDWESTRVSALSYLPLLPTIVAGFLACKAFSVVASIVAVARPKLVTNREIVRVIAIWATVTFAISLSFFLLIPDPRATWLWCLAITALVIPLARIIILPFALILNRHR